MLVNFWRLVYIFLAVVTAPCWLNAAACTPEEKARRVHAHLALHDGEGALAEVETGLELWPDSVTLMKARIEVLATIGQECAMLQAWHDLLEEHPEEKDDRQLLETMAWGIIQKGARSSSPITVAISLLAAHKGHDTRGVTLISEGLRSNNAIIRGLALELAGQMRDATLLDEVTRLLRQERVWAVRLAAIRAAGAMKLDSARGLLEEILVDPCSAAEEKAVAIEALVNLLDRADESRIRSLVSNRRAGLRLLACQAAVFCGQASDIPLLLPLLQDVNSEVRGIALQVIGVLRVSGAAPCDLREIAKKRLADNDPLVAISAAWLTTFVEPAVGQERLHYWLSHPKREVRLQAAAALVATGRHGLPLMRSAFVLASDPYVKMNLAFGLIGQRVDVAQACLALSGGLQLQERWMWGQDGLFRYVAPSREKHREGIPNYPEAVNQLVRLEVLNVLAMMKSPDALASIRRFLQERNWGISGMAAAVLLAEGNEDASELVAKLLDDPEPRVRMQAALVLGTLGGDTRALTVLHDSYAIGDRAMKERVLEAVGRIGQMDSVPFLVDRLAAPHQNLRLFAACALLQCLNH